MTGSALINGFSQMRARSRKPLAARVVVFAVLVALTSAPRATAAPVAAARVSGVTHTSAVQPTTQVLRTSFTGLQADAIFEWQTPPGAFPCVTTTASVSAKQGTTTVGPGHPRNQSTVQLNILTATGCSLASLSGASGTAVLAPGALHIDETLAFAQLDVTILVTDDTSVTVPVALHVTWVGTGALSSVKNHNHLRFPDATTIVDRFDGVTRAATATGSLSQQAHSPFLEFAGTAVAAGLGDVSYSYLTIVH
jgi:hypothetical protein